MMLCKELSEDEKSGITFKCIKDCYNMLDIIELEKDSGEEGEEEEEEEENPFNPSGYEELAQALRSVIWSNVDVNHGEAKYLMNFFAKQRPSTSSSFLLSSFFEREASDFQRIEQ